MRSIGTPAAGRPDSEHVGGWRASLARRLQPEPAMLSIGKLAGGPTAGRYYVDQVSRGAEDYYAGEGEAPGSGSVAALGRSA